MKYSKLLLFLALLVLSLLASLAAGSPSHSTACKTTRFPKLCRSILSRVQSPPPGPYGYGQYSLDHCLERAKRISQNFDRFASGLRREASLSRRAAGAVDDCSQLLTTNVQFLETVRDGLRTASQGEVGPELVADIRSRLSAVVTNQRTCVDGLAEVKGDILFGRHGKEITTAVVRVGRVYGVALGLVTQGLSQNTNNSGHHHNPHRHHDPHHHGHRHHHDQDGHTATLPPQPQLPADNPSKTPPPPPLPVEAPPQPPVVSTEAPSQAQALTEFIEGLKNGKTYKGDSIKLSNMEGNYGILVRDSVVVNKDGTGKFTRIGDAVDSAPENLKPKDGYFVIYASKGVYEEYITIPINKNNILLIGDGIDATVITGDHNHEDGWGTSNSATFYAIGERFIAIDVTFRNTAGPAKGQAVAVMNRSPYSIFYRCSLEGYQDTLYAHSSQQFYRDCDIRGTVDFIFGSANAAFQNCAILSRSRRRGQPDVITAQGREDADHFSGLSFLNCTIDAAPEHQSAGFTADIYLGRPWKPYATTVFMQSYLGPTVARAGWREMGDPNSINTLYYGEYDNHGPGASTRRRVDWPGYRVMDSTQALDFTVANLINGDTWLPETTVPFYSGLLES